MNKVQSVSVAVRTTGPISIKFGREALLNPVVKIALISYP